MSNGASGKSAAYADCTSVASSEVSLQLASPSDSGPTSAYRAGTSRHVMASLAGLVATVNPSMATSSSTYSTPFSSHWAISSSLIGREASAMSAPPVQNVAKPSPVPGPSTVTARPPPDISLASSPTRMLIGSTVEDPVTNTSPSASSTSPPPPAGASLPAGSVPSAIVVAGRQRRSSRRRQRPWSPRRRPPSRRCRRHRRHTRRGPAARQRRPRRPDDGFVSKQCSRRGP